MMPLYRTTTPGRYRTTTPGRTRTYLFLGHELRVTDAILEGHIMVQRNYLFFGKDVQQSVTWALAMKGDANPIFEAMQRSVETRRSVPVS